MATPPDKARASSRRDRQAWFDERARGRAIREDREIKALQRHIRLRAETAARSGVSPTSTPGKSTELVFKVVSWGKSQGHINRLVKYLGREGATHLQGANERSLSASDAQTIIRDDWALIRDDENLSKKAHALSKPERQELQEKERFKSRQFLHTVVSLPPQLTPPEGLGSEDGQRRLLTAFTAKANELFAEAGHQFLVFPHNDKGHLHYHLLVKAENDRPNGRRLHLDRDKTQALRQEFAHSFRQAGLPVQATQRRDRQISLQSGALEQAIADAINKPNSSWFQHQEALRDHKSQRDVFAKKAPEWHMLHGIGYEQRAAADPAQKGQLDTQLEKKDRSLINRLAKRFQRVEKHGEKLNLKINSDRLAVATQKMFKDHQAAMRSFAAMHREAPKLAIWTLNNRPIAFGDLIQDWKSPRLSAKDLSKSPEWFSRISNALPQFNTLSFTEKKLSQASSDDALTYRQQRLAATTAVRLKEKHQLASQRLLGLADQIEKIGTDDQKAALYARQIRIKVKSLNEPTPDLDSLLKAVRAKQRLAQAQGSNEKSALDNAKTLQRSQKNKPSKGLERER
ncbi:MAG: relaxase/mobilization nuclease domain-containing protein [Parvibaculaceae bacterium]|nr:relaxase/mobilization nuclease domain-containing protein [Parvibaculaceae bacterium]